MEKREVNSRLRKNEENELKEWVLELKDLRVEL